MTAQGVFKYFMENNRYIIHQENYIHIHKSLGGNMKTDQVSILARLNAIPSPSSFVRDVFETNMQSHLFQWISFIEYFKLRAIDKQSYAYFTKYLEENFPGFFLLLNNPAERNDILKRSDFAHVVLDLGEDKSKEICERRLLQPSVSDTKNVDGLAHFKNILEIIKARDRSVIKTIENILIISDRGWILLDYEKKSLCRIVQQKLEFEPAIRLKLSEKTACEELMGSLKPKKQQLTMIRSIGNFYLRELNRDILKVNMAELFPDSKALGTCQLRKGKLISNLSFLRRLMVFFFTVCILSIVMRWGGILKPRTAFYLSGISGALFLLNLIIWADNGGCFGNNRVYGYDPGITHQEVKQMPLRLEAAIHNSFFYRAYPNRLIPIASDTKVTEITEDKIDIQIHADSDEAVVEDIKNNSNLRRR